MSRPEWDKDSYGKGHIDGMKHGYASGNREGFALGFLFGGIFGVVLTLFAWWATTL